MSRDYLITADALGLHVILLKSCYGAFGIRDMARWSPPIGFNAGYYADSVEEAYILM